jgi:hypothetical protein
VTAAEIVEKAGASAAIARHQQAAEESTRRLILKPASQIRIRAAKWLWDTTPEGASPASHGRIPMNSLVIAAGGPGLGKSQFAVWLTAHITRGTLPGALYGQPRGVIYAATEDSWSHTIAPRLVAGGADLDLVYRVEVRDDANPRARLTLPVDTPLIGQAARESGVALMVADPLLSTIDRRFNDYGASEVREALEPLVEAADTYGFTILGLAHFTKSGGADPLNRVAGSGAFGQLVRSAIAFAEQRTDDGGSEYVMSLIKNNLGRLDVPSYTYTFEEATVETDEEPARVSRFVLGDETDTSVREVMREEAMPDHDREETNAVVVWLRTYLAGQGGCADSAEVKRAAKHEAISESSLHRAKRKLKIQTDTHGFGKNKVSLWTLPGTTVNPARTG